MAPDIKIPNNTEIDKALKKFEMESNAEEKQKVPEVSKISEAPENEVEGVRFETDSYKAVKFYNETNTPKIVKLVVKYSGGLIKKDEQANYVLFGFVIIAIIVSLFLFFGSPIRPTLDEDAQKRLMLIHPEAFK